MEQPRLELDITELATVAMLVEGAHTMNSAQNRLALSRGEVLERALAKMKAALREAGAVQDGPGWRPKD